MQRYVIMGVSGCGKSSLGAAFATAIGAEFIDGDALHPESNLAKMSAGQPLTDEDRAPWLVRVGQALRAATGPIVIACSALKRRYRNTIRHEAGHPVLFVHLSGSLEVLAARMAARTGHFMPPSLLDSQLAALEPPMPDENAVTLDIDQTPQAILAELLCILKQDRSQPQSQKPPTMKDVAKATHVSVMTVSRAFKQDASVSTETRDRIRQTAEAMGYVFDTAASNLRSQRSGFIAVTIPSINNANFADTVGALSEGLAAAGLQVLLGSTNYDIDQEEQLVEQFLRRRPEAIVVTGGRHTDRTRRLLSNAGIPVVETWDLPAAPIGHVVGFSNAATMQALVDHLITQGFARIAFIGGDTDGDTRGADRRRGFIAAMQRHGLTADRLIGAGQPPISMQEGAQAMGKLLMQMPDTDAVICVSDLSAFGALTECMRRGVAVPGQMAIAGFGAYEIAAVSVPTITTVNPFPREIGRQTADLIISVLAPDNRSTAMSVIEIKPEVTPGQSTAKPPAA